jgi:DMSO/TMAO reductase YedYZ molybdopterin-dependent catalytic subunit
LDARGFFLRRTDREKSLLFPLHLWDGFGILDRQKSKIFQENLWKQNIFLQNIMMMFGISQKNSGLHALYLIVFSLAAGMIPPFGTAQETSGLPPGQSAVDNFPVLHIGKIPDLDWTNWRLTITGRVRDTLSLGWREFLSLDTVQTVNDFHCVTGWSRLENRWTGVLIRDLFKKAHPDTSANYVTFKAADGYYTSLALEECTGGEDVLAFRWEGKLIDKTLGGPVRVVIPGKYGYKSAMWLTEIILTKEKERGYWEERGYSDSADPWKEERYAPAQNVDEME